MSPPLPAAFFERPLAHRGLHGPGVPENSLAAIRAAAETAGLTYATVPVGQMGIGEAQLDAIARVGVENYLAQQVDVGVNPA